jgi:hypothetical protein
MTTKSPAPVSPSTTQRCALLGSLFEQGEMLAVAMAGLVLTLILFGLSIAAMIPRRMAANVGVGD